MYHYYYYEYYYDYYWIVAFLDISISYWNPDVVVVLVKLTAETGPNSEAPRCLCTNFILTQTVPLIYDIFYLNSHFLYQERYLYVI